MHGVETVALAKDVGRRLRGAANTAELRHAVGRKRKFETGAHDRRADRIMAAAGAERRHGPLVVAMGEAQRVHLEGGVMEFRFGEIAHWAASSGWHALDSARRALISRMMKRADVGIPL